MRKEVKKILERGMRGRDKERCGVRKKGERKWKRRDGEEMIDSNIAQCVKSI